MAVVPCRQKVNCEGLAAIERAPPLLYKKERRHSECRLALRPTVEQGVKAWAQPCATFSLPRKMA